ncbi:hypothetical protein AQUCO_07500007v1 [Aquilegia coerulea]|uniref:Uncharacterized protein n=1 Tax=Aquilegia coerulea TaxID=218851 RepID=A0A2G5C936_AQUCA|nr:hypothetical protein AQUCO_07500007v1 [Aquilegia coerulea]
MAFVHYMVATSPNLDYNHSITTTRLVSLPPVFSSSSSFWTKARKLSHLSRKTFSRGRFDHKASAKLPESEAVSAADAFTQFKHLLLPITDKNPYLAEGTRQAAATVAAFAKKYEADITVLLMRIQKSQYLSTIQSYLASAGIFLKVGSRNFG